MEDNLPRCDQIRSVQHRDYFLSHAIWRNSMGSCQPETGVRRVVDGKVQGAFCLIQHGVSDFDFAERVILKCLRKGMDAELTGRIVEWLAKRRRVKATTN